LLALQLQQIEPLLRQTGHVADPDIEIGVTAPMEEVLPME